MPRATKSRRANADMIREDVTVTTATEETEMQRTDLPFTVDITPAEEGFKPDRSPAGRKRIPSPFEEKLPPLKGQGWQNQPHDGQVTVGENGKVDIPQGVKGSNAAVILRELQKAVKFLNIPRHEGGDELNLGLDVNVTASLVQFNVRDKQNRKPRTAPGGGEVSDGEQGSDDDDTSGDE